ncbi:MAG: hypothetical protein K8U57_25050 [Planctomycetes bacterium]|nr:hypothetical protein [Planctomycetota bacterium]
MIAHKNTTKLLIEGLESREMMSVSSVAFNAGVVTVWTDNNATAVTATAGTTANSIKISDGGSSRTWNYTGVSRVEFVGGAGNDRFVDNAGSINCNAWGNGGDDLLKGANGANQLMGGDGNDTLVGGTGNNKMWGGNGNDNLIDLNGTAADFLQGDAGSDAYWVPTSNVPAMASDSSDKFQRVGGFANGADKVLNGHNIADPALEAGNSFKRFGGPLFATGGPSYADIRQGNIGDCWLLSGLGAIATDNPTAIRRNVVDFGDGSFGVRLGNNFYREDADLPTQNFSTPSAANLGVQGSLWVAIAEKAYAQYRVANGTSNSYAALEGGWSVDVNKAFGATTTVDKAISSFGSATAFGNAMYTAWNSYSAVTIGFNHVPNGAPLIGDHMYQVYSFTRDAAGNVTTVTLRNPWGVDGAGHDSNVNDGLVTVSVATLAACTGRVNWGIV